MFRPGKFSAALGVAALAVALLGVVVGFHAAAQSTSDKPPAPPPVWKTDNSGPLLPRLGL